MKPLKTHKPKCWALALVFLMFGYHALAQDRMFVITDRLNVHEKPDVQSPVLGVLALGDSVMIADYTESKTTAIVNELAVSATWAKIEYHGKVAWVFGGALCYMMLNPQYWQALYPEYDSLKMRKDIDKLVKDGTLTIGGNHLKFKAKNGKTVYVYECACLHENRNCQDGHNVSSLVIKPQNLDIVEVEMSVVAFSVKVYVDLKNGTKFNFPDEQACMISEISPNTKYVIGLSMISPKKQLLLFDFSTNKLVSQAYVESFGDITHLKWLNNQEVELQRMNYETNQMVKKRILLIPSMQWKK